MSSLAGNLFTLDRAGMRAAAGMWARGMNTKEIAVEIGEPEDIVSRSLQAYRDLKSGKVTRYQTYDGKTFQLNRVQS